MESSVKKNKRLRQLIVLLSIIIPLAVAALFGIRIEGIDLGFLPGIYATINGVTAVLLVLALILVKQKKFKLHETVIKICMVLSVLFLLCYVAYHMTSDPTKYGDINGDGELSDMEQLTTSAGMRLTYFILLISHITLSVIVIPMVLYSYLFAMEENFNRHRKLVKYAWPVWFYVAASGVVVYLMISPFYQHA